MKKSVKMAQSIVGDSKNRNKNDLYITPPHAVISLLEKEIFVGSVWEPACGNGAISRVLIERGFSVKSTDLFDYGYGVSGVDFLSCENRATNIITNPPFSLSSEFVYRALDRTEKKVAFLLKLAFLETVKRKRLFEETPLKKVWVFSKRLSMYGLGDERRGGGMIAFAWFVWELGYVGDPTIGWI